MPSEATATDVAVTDERATDPWDHWRRSLAGERVPYYEDCPEWGYYKLTKKTLKPVAIFERDGGLTAVVGTLGNPEIADPASLWRGGWLSPITKQVYDMTARDGNPFGAAVGQKYIKRPASNPDGKAWRQAKARIMEAAANGKGLRLTAEETAQAAQDPAIQ